MASTFGHAFTAYTIGKTYPKSINSWKFMLLGIVCSIVPDTDVIAFNFGIPYDYMFGHRGFFHSFLFAGILGFLVTLIFYYIETWKWKGLALFLYVTICAASHSLLDAMTSGGLGVAFFSPWDTTRYFFSWRPIKVSPIGFENFLSSWGWNVLKSELIWIGIPCIFVLIINSVLSKIVSTKT